MHITYHTMFNLELFDYILNITTQGKLIVTCFLILIEILLNLQHQHKKSKSMNQFIQSPTGKSEVLKGSKSLIHLYQSSRAFIEFTVSIDSVPDSRPLWTFKFICILLLLHIPNNIWANILQFDFHWNLHFCWVVSCCTWLRIFEECSVKWSKHEINTIQKYVRVWIFYQNWDRK